MPSDKNPKTAVSSGPGRLPAGVVPAGALMFTPGSGPSTAVQMHLIHPTDAHMASAIGIPALNAGNHPLLWDAGGVIDGESVLDFIDQLKDLVPPFPNYIGYDLPLGVNSGVPNWDRLDTSNTMTGGYSVGGNTLPTHYIVSDGVDSFSLTGIVFPADRGVLALYRNTDGDFFNTGTTTLYAALSLSPAPLAPPGIPRAQFNETLRTGQQADHTVSAAMYNKIGLTWRLPYLKDYTPYAGCGFSNYADNFFRFQLARYTVSDTIAVGGDQNWLLVHWKEGYATTLSSIQSFNLKIGTLVAANCYSSVPVVGDFDDDTHPSFTVNRHHVFRDSGSASVPVLETFVTSPVVLPATQQYSGVPFYNDRTLVFSIQLAASGLAQTAFQLGQVAAPPDVPARFLSTQYPMVLNFDSFGAIPPLPLAYTALNKQGSLTPYSISNAPQPTDVVAFGNASFALPATRPGPFAAFTPTSATGLSALTVDFHKVFAQLLHVADPQKYLFNTFPAAGSAPGSGTDMFEGFVNERYRYVTAPPPPLFSKPLVPAGGDVFDSTQSLATMVDPDSLQIIGNCLVYPQADFSGCLPHGPDYSGNPGADGADHKRRYVRAFDTLSSRSTGKLRLKFLPGCGSSTAFNANADYDGTEETGHLVGGMILGLQVWGIGPTGWLDAGRALGFPGAGTLDYYGCRTSITTVDAETYLVEYDTGTPTVDNGSGKFPLFVRLTFLNNAAGRALRLDSIEWMVP